MIKNNVILYGGAAGLSLAEVYRVLGVTRRGGVESLTDVCGYYHGKVNKWSKVKPIALGGAGNMPWPPTEAQRRESNTPEGEYYGVKLIVPADHDITTLDSWRYDYAYPVTGRHWSRLTDWDGYHHTVGPYPQCVARGWTPGSSSDRMNGKAETGFNITLPLALDDEGRKYGVNLVAMLVGEQWDKVKTDLYPLLIVTRGDTVWARLMHNLNTRDQSPLDMSKGVSNAYYYTPLDMMLKDAGGSYVDAKTRLPYCRAWIQDVNMPRYGMNNEYGNDACSPEQLLQVLTQTTAGGYVYASVVLITTPDSQTTVLAPSTTKGDEIADQYVDFRRWVPLHRLTVKSLGLPCVPVPWPYGASGTAYRARVPLYIDGSGQAPVGADLRATATRRDGNIVMTVSLSGDALSYYYKYQLVVSCNGCEQSRKLEFGTGRDDIDAANTAIVFRPEDFGWLMLPTGNIELWWFAYEGEHITTEPTKQGKISC